MPIILLTALVIAGQAPAPIRPAPPIPVPGYSQPRDLPPVTRPRLRSGSIRQPDYPASALRDRVEGIVSVSLTVGTDGRVTGCSVTRSARSNALDSTTCSLAQRRFRFEPGRDMRGNAVPSQFAYQMDWRLPR